MKIAVCSKGNDLKDLSDERFGRCETFVIFDTETKESFAVNNEAKNEGAGAGGKAVKILSDRPRVVFLGKNDHLTIFPNRISDF